MSAENLAFDRSKNEWPTRWALLSTICFGPLVVTGVALVTSILQNGHPAVNTVLAYLLFGWSPTVFVLGMETAFKASKSVILGTAISIAIFHGWVAALISLSGDPQSGNLWLFAWLTLPGVIIGAILSAVIIRKRKISSFTTAAVIASICIFIGIVSIQFFSCHNLIYCGFK